MIRKQWVLLQFSVPPHFSVVKSLLYKLDKLRLVVRSWELDYKKKDEESLVLIEKEIASSTLDVDSLLFCLVQFD